MSEFSEESVRADVREWLNENWDPNAGLLEWRNTLVDSGWGMPHWPAQWYGRGMPVGLGPVVDEEFAAVQGVPVDRFMKGIVLMLGLSIVLLIQLVGIVLVIALLTIPAVVSLMLTQDFLGVMVRSAIVGGIMTLGGLALSYAYDLPSGPAIVLLGLALLLLVSVTQKLAARRGNRFEFKRTDPEDSLKRLL